MLSIALQMLAQKKIRLFITAAGLACLFFLSTAQVGMLVGWCNTVAALVVHSNVDLWVMSPLTPAFDYGTPLPGKRVYQVRSIPGVAWAEGIYVDWSMWQRADGKRISIELVGLDDSSIGGPWSMRDGRVENVHLPGAVLVNRAFLGILGVTKCGDEVELFGQRAIVRGITEDVRTFTASPFVFTSLQTARRFDGRYRGDEVTYVLVRCRTAESTEEVRNAILRDVPDIEVLTTRDFAVRTILYWMLETGIGVTVVITAVLGFCVSAIVVSQTLYTITLDNATHYATLLAIGFSRWKVLVIVLTQSQSLAVLGLLPGSLGYLYAAWFSRGTPVPLETGPLVFIGIAVLYLAGCATASFLSVKAVFQIDPSLVFRS